MRIVAIAAAALTLAAAPAPAPAAGDGGRFVVTQVVINPALDTRQLTFHADDPRLVGRFVEVAPSRLAMDGSSACTQVRRLRRTGSPAALLRAGFAPASANRRRPIRLMAIGLPDSARATALIEYRCLTPAPASGPAPGRDWWGAVGFPLPGGRRALYWQTEALLVLTPFARVPQPLPSFDCAGAIGKSERAICADPSLANWDRSVATAFRLARDGGGPDAIVPSDDPAALAASQREWLIRRDACAADRACLANAMGGRVEELMRRF